MTCMTKPVSAAIALVLCNSVAFSQTTTLEEVVVTATKRAASLQDIPITVNAISEKTIREAGITDIVDVAALVPALTVSTNINPFASALRIRGFGTSQNDPSLEASVAFLVDGVYMGRSGLGMSDLTDIERIEVLQGPQGTLYGKNSNAGVISVITKNPNMEETEGYVETSFGDYSMQKYVGSVTGPITDTLGYLVAGSWHEHDGWLKSNTGDDLNAAQDWNARGKIRWQPTDLLSIQLTASHVDRDTSCCAADATQTSAVTDQLIAQGLPVPKNDAFNYKNNVDVDSNFDLKSDAANIKMDYELDSATLTSLTSWNDYDYKTSTDADRSELAILALVDDKYTGELWTQELRLTSDIDGPLQYILGGFYANEKLTRGGTGEGVAKIGDDIIAVGGASTGLGPGFGVLVQPGDTVFIDNSWKTESYAIFGQSTYNFSERWAATLGLRYTNEDKEASLFAEPVSTAAAAATGAALVQLAFAPVDDSFHRNSDGFTWLANLTFFMTDEIMMFTSVSTGSKSGGFNGVAGEGAPREFDDEDTTNYELGIKSQLLDNRLQINGSIFYTKFKELQFLAQQPAGVGTFVSNAAEGTSAGVDLNFSAAPWDFLMLSGGLQYLDAQYGSGELDDQGFDVPYAPHWSGNFAATLMLPVAKGVSYLRGDYSYMSDHFTNPTYQVSSAEQDKTRVNVRLGWRNENWDGALWVKNATDNAYSSLAAAPIAYSGTQAQFLAAPRTYGVTVRYTF
ncbi:MAG: TonB-dependent receptor [Halioglobus sp.]|nr:TonB-dependent receptor [Halioglobus sp.]